MRRQTVLTAFAAAATGILAVQSPAAQQYSFTNIIDSTDPNFGFFLAGPMNDAGQVAFFNYGAGTNPAGLYLFDGTDVHLVEALPAAITYAQWGIDGAGNVYYSRVFSGSDGIYMASVNNPTVTIFDDVTNGFDTVDVVWVNEAGDVSFGVYYDSPENSTCYAANATTPPNTVVTLADATTGGYDFVAQPYIRDDGEVLLLTTSFAVPDDDARLQTTNISNPPNTLTTQVDAFGEFSHFGYNRFNAAGVMLIQARRDVYGVDEHLYIGTSSHLVKCFQASDPQWTGVFGPMDINDHGQVAFTMQLEGQTFQQRGVYDSWHDPATNMVVGNGTPLFGDTCTYAINNVGSINQSGQIAFWYRLSNGVEGIAIATPIDCVWDLNFDDTVNTTDLLMLLASWGACPGCPGDFDGSGDIATADMLQLLANWGDCGEPRRSCCLADGSCEDATVTDCLLMDGIPGDTGTACLGDIDGDFIDDVCAGVIPTEACCFDNGDCLNVHPDGCLSLGGTSAGAGTVCLGDNDLNGIDDACAALVDTVACCIDGDTCYDATEEDCIDNGDTPLWDGSFCFGSICVFSLPGGCCIGETCTMADDSEECENMGGVFMGHGTDCVDITCGGFGACCAFGKCVEDVDQVTCEKKYGGTFQGPGSTCEKSDCVIGACCVDGECFDDLAPEDCEKVLGGVYMGDFTLCEKEVCP